MDVLAKELNSIKLSLFDKDYSEKDLNEELELVESILETLEIKAWTRMIWKKWSWI